MFMGNVRGGNGLDSYVTTNANIDWGNFRGGGKNFCVLNFHVFYFHHLARQQKCFAVIGYPGRLYS